MTAFKEDYLKTIYNLNGDKEVISNKQLVQALEISPASVSEMILKLQAEDLVTYIPYQGVMLTQKGIEHALPLVRAHRLWEVFLKDYLHYTLVQVHQDAELLEHTSSPLLVERLDQLLEYPTVCPHGSPIPDKEGKLHIPPLVCLTFCKKGEQGVLYQVEDSLDFLLYLEKEGLSPGDEILVLKNDTIEKEITIQSKEKIHVLPYQASNCISIRK